MTKLEKYLERKNAWNKIFNAKTYDAKNLTQADAKAVFEMLDCDLSPENLCCDGEASRAQVKAKYALYTGAVKDLAKLGFAFESTY